MSPAAKKTTTPTAPARRPNPTPPTPPTGGPPSPDPIFDDAVLPTPAIADSPTPQAVQLTRTFEPPTPDEYLWAIIKNRAEAIQFRVYKNFMDTVLLKSLGKIERADAAKDDWGAIERLVDRVNAYDVLKTATELFLMAETGLVPPTPAQNYERLVTSGDQADLNATLLQQLKQVPATPAGQLPPVSWPTGGSTNGGQLQVNTENLKRGYLAKLSNSPSGQVLPYYALIIERLEDLPPKPEIVAGAAYEYGILREAATRPPMVELIWSYWHEQGMLIQTMAAVATRFQNRRVGNRDPLANLNIDPLRGANNLLWGWIQDEISRLTVPRRAYEYASQYGLSMFGRAVPPVEAADNRSKFLRSFHELLALCVKFFEADDDTTVIADPFPVLNALKEVHMVLAEGAHNQFGDLPWVSRVEIMIMQWILARPEFREFLGGRVMVPYDEEWMDRVDSMRLLQGWGDTSVSHFRDLAVYGEQILLSIRYGNWMTSAITPQAANWARTWREEIQIYIHAYRTVTGVDLTAEPVDARAVEDRWRQPSDYLRQQESARQRRLPAGRV
jgi:hypothetical protein